MNKLSEFRKTSSNSNIYKEFGITSEALKISIVGRRKKEAAKLAGLILSTKNLVKSLDQDGYVMGVIEKYNITDHAEKFKVWRASDKIYTESICSREVSISRPMAMPLMFQ